MTKLLDVVKNMNRIQGSINTELHNVDFETVCKVTGGDYVQQDNVCIYERGPRSYLIMKKKGTKIEIVDVTSSLQDGSTKQYIIDLGVEPKFDCKISTTALIKSTPKGYIDLRWRNTRCVSETEKGRLNISVTIKDEISTHPIVEVSSNAGQMNISFYDKEQRKRVLEIKNKLIRKNSKLFVKLSKTDFLP